jgi:hypothetical protein
MGQFLSTSEFVQTCNLSSLKAIFWHVLKSYSNDSLFLHTNSVGLKVGNAVIDGNALGNKLSLPVGWKDGMVVGSKLGLSLGYHEGTSDGSSLGFSLGTRLGLIVGRSVGFSLGTLVGSSEGNTVGA